jgi:hypothetical protein
LDGTFGVAGSFRDIIWSRRMRTPFILLIAAAALSLAACGHNVEQRAASGAVAGAVVGGPVGAAVGGAAGAAVSKGVDKD